MKTKGLKRISMGRVVLLSLSALMMFLAGCQEKDYYDPSYRPPGHVGDNPSTLDFSTTRNVVFDLNYDAPDGTVSTFQVYSQNPFQKSADGSWEMRSDLQPVTAGIRVAGGAEVMRVLPAFLTELYLYSPDLFAPTLMHAQISNERATFEEIDLGTTASHEGVATRTYGSQTVDHYLTGNSLKVVQSGGVNYYRPYDQFIVKEEFPASVRNSINKAFPNGRQTDPQYYTDASIYIEQDGGDGQGVEVLVSVISSDAKYHNSLAYFCYDGTKEELAKMMNSDARKDLYVIGIFQSARVSLTVPGALKPGEYVKLKYYNKATKQLEDKFPVGTTISWVLPSDGFSNKSGSYYIKNRGGEGGSSWYYSMPSWNFEYKGNKNHTTIFTAKDGNKEYVCFGFEDENNDSQQGDGDCNDVMFHIKLNPSNAIIPPPTIPEDGVTEEVATAKGYLAFEDNWPFKGDYDLNDVVVKYESTITYVQKTVAGEVLDPCVRKVVDNFSFVHSGADFNNAFAYKVNVSPQQVEKVTIDGQVAQITPDGTGFLVELCPNVNEVIVPYEYGTTPKDYTVVMEFKEDKDLCVTQAAFNRSGMLAPYNPYISPESGVEVHLPMYLPTTKATGSLFGTGDDRSGNSFWYVSGDKNNYPFAIHLSGITNFTIPVEKESIDKTYPTYINWVESEKKEDTDWYLYPKN